MIVIIACDYSYEGRYCGAVVIPDDISLESLLETFLDKHPGHRRSFEFAEWLLKEFPAVSQGVREIFYTSEGLTMYNYDPEWSSKYFAHHLDLREDKGGTK